jgi:bromodomain adjacent to zinc finger domain protein 1A
MICRKKSDPEQTLLCDECNKGYHMYCLKPKITTVPKGDWFCVKCRPENFKETTTRKRRQVIEIEEEEEEEEEEDEEEDEEMDTT